jgi:hypothetical protein
MFFGIAVSCNTYGGELFTQNAYCMGELQKKYENILCNVFASFTFIRYIL